MSEEDDVLLIIDNKILSDLDNKIEAQIKKENKMSKLKAKSPKEVTPGKIKMMIFSKSGIGKTWISMDFPAPYYIDSEGGARLGRYQDKLLKAGGAYLGVDDGALDFPTVLDQIKTLATEKHDYKTLTIGSITKLYQTAIAIEAERLGTKNVFGASKKPAYAYMRRLVNWIMKLDMNVLFEAHETSEWGINPETKMREEIGNGPDIWDKLEYELDLTLRLQKRGPDRVAVIRKSRLEGFPEGESFPLTYVEFGKRYGVDFIESEVHSLTIATSEQVEEIEKFLSLVKIEEKEIKKILSKAKADSWADLTTEQAIKTIAWLKEKIGVNNEI